ncbi:MAG: type II toxin-antitoxin system HicA family toxin [Acidobacteria bacterium]|jgi:predicted RNA binding protein YcfA (HicA-like mRNA interferase family)|nr:MAG: type II toxin-antitoxin system HicA family toxin [Acidobacteriota bacterium]
MPRLPQVSGRALIRLLSSLGYEVIRQRGSHIRVRKISALGEHNLTVPDHAVLAKGTLNDILTRVSLWNNIPKEKLVEELR